MEWTEETVACLRGLWSEGLPTAEIGRRLGITKNAVIGKAHRLVLPPRPSPIRVVAATAEVHAETKASVGSGRVASAAGAGNPGSGAMTAMAQAAWSPPPRAVPPPHRVEPPPFRRAHSCCWPLGEPGKPGFHFCDDAALPTKPYCARHADLAYVKVREKREEAA